MNIWERPAEKNGRKVRDISSVGHIDERRKERALVLGKTRGEGTGGQK